MDMSETKDLIRDIIGKLQPVAANAGLRNELNALLAAPAVSGVPYTRTIKWNGVIGNALAGGATTQASWSTDANAPFLIQAGTYFADIALAVQTDSTRVVPLVDVQLANAGTGAPLFDAPVPVPCMFGTGQEPFVWPSPFVMPANSVLLATPLNRTAATTYNLTLCFHGVRLLKQ